MKIAWLQPWFRRNRAPTASPLIAREGRWLVGRLRHRRSCELPPSAAGDRGTPPAPVQRLTLTLGHHLDVSLATQHLAHHLDCDAWHVAVRHDHQLVVQLTQFGLVRYCVVYDCTPAIEKAVYHGSRAWALTIIPQDGDDNLPAEKVAEIRSALAALHG